MKNVIFGVSILILANAVTACGELNAFKSKKAVSDENSAPREVKVQRSTIWDAINRSDHSQIKVNRFIWQAALDVLDFMPIDSIDPFSGVIVMGYGTPPGSKLSYRATVFVSDPALDARSIKLSLSSKNGPVPSETVNAVADSILTRARQLRKEASFF